MEETLGKTGAYLVYMFIGGGLGASLEMAGFGDSRKLAAQFYFKDMTVLKVMFTAIIFAMLLIFISYRLGFLDYNVIWVNPTYLFPGIVGGLIMGVGFIVGGFCPGTSLVATATLKLDGLFFFLGCLFGIFVFGETISSFGEFWHSSFLGRFTLPQWLGLDTGTVVFLVVLMALGMFFGAEYLEKIFGDQNACQFIGVGCLKPLSALTIVLAIMVMVIGEPTALDKWEWVKEQKQETLKKRAVYIHPAELMALQNDYQIHLMVLDMRKEADYNIFHIIDSKRVTFDKLDNFSYVAELLNQPKNTIFVLVANDEDLSTLGWKMLVAQNLPNAYILEGGINYWLDLFLKGKTGAYVPAKEKIGQMRHSFDQVVGDSIPAAKPDHEHFSKISFTKKVKLEQQRVFSGGCG